MAERGKGPQVDDDVEGLRKEEQLTIGVRSPEVFGDHAPRCLGFAATASLLPELIQILRRSIAQNSFGLG